MRTIVPHPPSHCVQAVAYQFSNAVSTSSETRIRLWASNSSGAGAAQAANAIALAAVAAEPRRNCRRVTPPDVGAAGFPKSSGWSVMFPSTLTNRYRPLLVARGALGRRIVCSVAADAVAHGQWPDFGYLPHMADIAVACLA